MSKDFNDYNLIFHLPFSVGYLLCTILISPCYYLIKQNKNYNGTHNVNSAHCNFIIELFMTLYFFRFCTQDKHLGTKSSQ